MLECMICHRITAPALKDPSPFRASRGAAFYFRPSFGAFKFARLRQSVARSQTEDATNGSSGSSDEAQQAAALIHLQPDDAPAIQGPEHSPQLGPSSPMFAFMEKVKRTRIQQVANALLQLMMACLFFTAVRGVFSPLVAVFSSQPPDWRKLSLMISAIDYIAIAYLAAKARAPMLAIASFPVEEQQDVWSALEKEEEMNVALAEELAKLFKRMRNTIGVVAAMELGRTVLPWVRRLDPEFVANISNFTAKMLLAPWS